MLETEDPLLVSIPAITEDALVENIRELKDLITSIDSESSTARVELYYCLIRNRRNLLDVLRSGRFL